MLTGAPVIIDQSTGVLRRARDAGEPAVLLVEQCASLALDITDQAVVFDGGRDDTARASTPCSASPWSRHARTHDKEHSIDNNSLINHFLPAPARTGQCYRRSSGAVQIMR